MKITGQNNDEEPATRHQPAGEIGIGELAARRAESPPPAGDGAGADRGTTPRMWRSFDELAQTPDFEAVVDHEFPRYAPGEWHDGVSRRTFLRLSGASIGLAGATACTRQPAERIVPYVEQPEHVVPGKASYYATAMTLAGYALPLLATSHLGRPTQLAGNPDHPASLGGANVYGQAATLGLYDPDRSQSIEKLGRQRPWQSFVGEIEPTLRALEALSGDGLRILSHPTSSPTFGALMERVLARFPRARWVQFEGAFRDDVLRGTRMVFGPGVELHYNLARAAVVVALDSDLLAAGPGSLRYARDYARVRSVRGGKRTMNRLYALETGPSSTGASADHRLPVNSQQLHAFTLALAARVGLAVAAPPLAAPLDRWLEAIAGDLEQHRGGSLVVAGEHTPAELQALVHAINERLGNVGLTVIATDPVLVSPQEQLPALRELVADMAAGRVEALFVLGANPVYDAPADLDLAGALARVRLRVHLGQHRDESAARCQWHLPQAHFLEGWGDARAYDGTVSLVQPLIEPLYEGKTDLQLLALLLGTDRTDYDLVHGYWQQRLGAGAPAAWRQALHDGMVAGTALPPRAVTVDPSGVASAAARVAARASAPAAGLELQVRPDPSVYDGRFANNGWLQELPKPVTLIAWDNSALVAPQTALDLGLESHQVVRLSHGGRALELPVMVQPGQPKGVITLHLGFGRTRAGRVGNGVGQNANRLRTSEHPWTLPGVELLPTGRKHRVACTQSHFVIRGLPFQIRDFYTETEQVQERHLIKQATLDHYREHPDFTQHQGHPVDPAATLFPAWEYQGYSWGMAIDLTACIGCNACVLACVSENNIPVVGRGQVVEGREMHWLRIDRYFEGSIDNPRVHHQPMACQHCEKAPCEIVCPVGATVHGPEGLNEMIYNRCVGTRYCSNNCPYKVRRFNFLRYQDTETPVLAMARNPDVTVRSRGVMEKCSYCVQRISRARIAAKLEDRRIRDGEVKTACQEACPTSAIVFGDLNDASSEVNRWKAEPTNYAVLPELSTQPRTTYLAKLRNPNPALEGASAGAPRGHADPSEPSPAGQH